MFINSTNNHRLLGGNRGVLVAAEQLLKENKSFALAIVVHATGSTYRKPGALALFADDERTQSVISGGCLESTWHKIASEVLTNNQPQSLLLDTHSDDDLIFGSGSGCRGSMRLVIIPVHPTNVHPLYTAISSSQAQHQSLTLSLLLDHPYCGHGQAVNASDQWNFGVHSSAVNELRNGECGEHQIVIGNSPVTAAVFSICPAPRLLLIGASVETPFLIRIGHSLGWHITVIDHRPAQREQLAQAADVLIDGRLQANSFDAIPSFNAVLIMSHSATTDFEAMRILSARNDPYIGLLGPPARRDELLSQLTIEQRTALMPRLHAPMGLRLGGNGPEPLALSIAAELQKFFNAS